MYSHSQIVLTFVRATLLSSTLAYGQLSPTFYDESCPYASCIIGETLKQAFISDARIGASLIRLHFHDCFVNGCDGSILLDKTDSIDTEKEALANNNSARGFEVIDTMKTRLESICPATVSCADILTIAAQQSVTLTGGPAWTNLLGRRDSLTANRTLANQNIPGPFDTLVRLRQRFENVGMNNGTDLVALSGAHTFGKAQCRTFINRLYNFNNTGEPDPTLDPIYRDILREICPEGGNGTVITDLDPTTPNQFDNNYFSNLLIGKGLLQSDQELFSTPGATDTIDLVNKYSNNQSAFFQDFVDSMIKMGNLNPLIGNDGEIRLNCRFVNGSPAQADIDNHIYSSM